MSAEHNDRSGGGGGPDNDQLDFPVPLGFRVIYCNTKEDGTGDSFIYLQKVENAAPPFDLQNRLVGENPLRAIRHTSPHKLRNF